MVIDKEVVLNNIVSLLKDRPEIHAAWEGGSQATGFVDEFSDIDLCVVADAPIQGVIERVQRMLEEKFGVSHTWQTAKSGWGEGIAQRVIVLKNAPEFFSVDLGVMDRAVPQAYGMFLEVERHGTPRILFDKGGILHERHADAAEIFARQTVRAEELRQGFPIFKSLTLKELRRGHPIDAISFYQNGLVRPLVEVMAMNYRPYRWDFGLRYLHRDFPEAEQKLIQELSYVADVADLPAKVARAEAEFLKAIAVFKGKRSLEG
ncbi:MAG: hypothetical protein KF767_03475 [Bdellovibrionaceae bacterium]|nr:hypothetical protein [Pseudobdellovibrionaceae bacterium]